MKWQKVSLDSLKAGSRYSFVGGPFGSNLTSRDYVEEGIPVIRGTNLSSDREFLDEGFVFVREEKADALRSNTAHAGDLVFTQRGTLGQVGIIPENSIFSRYIISQSQMKLTVDAKRVNSRYVYYYFRHPETVQKVINHALTSGVPHINLGILKDFEIPLPPISVQTEIVKILSTYDDLIENNRRRMTLLEDAARHVYQEWFVHLRFPGREHTRIVDGVPDGWEKMPLESALVLQRGFDLPSQARQEGIVPIYASTGVNGYHNTAKVKAPGIVTGRSGSLGMVHYVHEDFWPLNTSLWVKEFRRVSPLFTFFLLSSLRLDQYNGGVSVPTLDRKVVHKIEVVVPNGKIQALFNDYVLPMFTQLRQLGIYNDKLRTARDLLLPKLMSGEIAV